VKEVWEPLHGPGFDPSTPPKSAGAPAVHHEDIYRCITLSNIIVLTSRRVDYDRTPTYTVLHDAKLGLGGTSTLLQVMPGCDGLLGVRELHVTEVLKSRHTPILMHMSYTLDVWNLARRVCLHWNPFVHCQRVMHPSTGQNTA
jgi:hypothetical protein